MLRYRFNNPAQSRYNPENFTISLQCYRVLRLFLTVYIIKFGVVKC
ncbi:hypothetical protein K661_00703 [Piscirickettsia salmonis LF-89 = ATCC VR-1361]|nr:hypothetical protein K661_00703 [Piscirickettsia salmonis LF-89 = ATCC VR-1361]